MCLDKAGVAPEDVDCILVATITPDVIFPATACLVQNNLGASNAWGYDISAACSGFLYALTTGSKMIESGMHKKVLVIGGDTMSRIIDYTDRATCIIFGDGAGAVLLEPTTDGTGVRDAVQYADGSGVDFLMPARRRLAPSGHARDRRRATALRPAGRQDRLQARRRRHGRGGRGDHGAQRPDARRRPLSRPAPGQPAHHRRDGAAGWASGRDKVMLNIEKYGNTTAGTLPLCLGDWEGRAQSGDNVVLAAFGGGFTWGATYLTWAYDGIGRGRGLATGLAISSGPPTSPIWCPSLFLSPPHHDRVSLPRPGLPGARHGRRPDRHSRSQARHPGPGRRRARLRLDRADVRRRRRTRSSRPRSPSPRSTSTAWPPNAALAARGIRPDHRRGAQPGRVERARRRRRRCRSPTACAPCAAAAS